MENECQSECIGSCITFSNFSAISQKCTEATGISLPILYTFKENCPDIRNTKAIDVINELKQYNCDVDTFDPWANNAEVKHEYGIDLIDDYSNTKLVDKSTYAMIIRNVRKKQRNVSGYE